MKTSQLKHLFWYVYLLLVTVQDLNLK